MKKVLCFPYHPDIDTLMKWQKELQDYQIVGVYSYREDQIQHQLNRQLGNDGSDLEHLLAQCDAVLFLDNYRNCSYEKYYSVLDMATKSHKEILLTPAIASSLHLNSYSGGYTILSNCPQGFDIYLSKKNRLKKYPMDVPIIAVFGMGKNCGKFDTLLMVQAQLIVEGYHSIALSSNALGALFGCYTLPDFLYSHAYTFEEKILRFNNGLYELSLSEHPDVFVIGVPGGIFEFESVEYNHFSELPLIISKAIDIDIAILSTYHFTELRKEGLQKMYEKCLYQYGAPVYAFSIGHTSFETDIYSIHYCYLDDEYIQKFQPDTSQIPFPVIIDTKEEKSKRIVSGLIQTLASNLDAV